MRAANFRCPEAGTLVTTVYGHVAFSPAPLPPVIDYDASLVLALSRADAALSELSGLGRLVPNPHLLIAPYTRREAVLSSRIEGTRATLAEVLRDEIEEATARPEDADVREVRNYVDALRRGVELLSDLPISLRLVKELHTVLLSGARGENLHPGEFRTIQNWIGTAGSGIENAQYVPPPPTEMLQALYQWEAFAKERDRLPDLIQCALLHEQFEAIHPFLDGNGRLGRLLITLFLMERGRLSQPLLYLSAYIERHRSDYYDLLQGVRTDCRWDAWLRYFLAGVLETSWAAIAQARQILDLREEYRLRLREKPHALKLLDELFLNPYITIARAEAVLRVSHPVAWRTVLTLEESGLLTEITGRAWGRTYLAAPILRAIDPGE